MRRVAIPSLCGGLVFWAFVTLAMHTTPPAPHPPVPQFQGGATSVDALLDDLLAAVAAHDEAALNRLRVTEEEYRTIIVPGTAEPGQPPRKISDHVSEYFWHMLDAKSRDLTYAALGQFGGQQLTRREVRYTKGVKQYQGYTALGEVRMQVVNTNGEKQEFRSGTIAEVGGRYKFIGLNWND